MPGPFAPPRNSWFCAGCGRTHPISRDIEGSADARHWCAASLRRGIEAKHNDLPPQAYDRHGNLRPASFFA